MQVGNVYKNFIQMKKVYEDKPDWVKLHSSMLTGDIKNPVNTNVVDLAGRVSIDKGTLTSEEQTIDEYSFEYPNRSEASYQNRIKFYNILNVDVAVTSVTIGNKLYSFNFGTSPVIGIQNLPLEKVEPDHGSKDYDFELVYKLTPEIPEKRLPTFHKQGLSAKPVICPLTWFES
ncbi:MAG: hypothetical protein WAQ98_19030 [Blastocatellia bacterium]